MKKLQLFELIICSVPYPPPLALLAVLSRGDPLYDYRLPGAFSINLRA